MSTICKDKKNMRYFIRLSYAGTAYHGWQIQENAHTVQACLEEALGRLLGQEVGLTGCGRTDTGVHAHAYVAHFDLDRELEAGHFLYKINAILPTDIRVHALCPVSPTAHARFDANERTYKYFLSPSKEPFLEKVTARCPFPLDLEAMNRAAALLLGTHDFTSFAKLHAPTKTNVCTLSRASWTREELPPFGTSPVWVFTISANRFLRNMVRAVVGSLIEVGRGKRPEAWVAQLLQARDRCLAGGSVPAQGLHLWAVGYPAEVLAPQALANNLQTLS